MSSQLRAAALKRSATSCVNYLIDLSLIYKGLYAYYLCFYVIIVLYVYLTISKHRLSD
jgi:hypothetical protein